MNACRWVAVVVSVALAPAAAWAEQEVSLARSKLTVRIPDGWVVSATDDADELRGADGATIGKVRFYAAPCAEILARALATATAPVVASTREVTAGWTGWMVETPGFLSTDAPRRGGLFCREFGVGGKVFAMVVEAPEDHVTELVAIVDAAVERAVTPGTPTVPTPRPRPPGPAPWLEAKPSLLSRLLPQRYEAAIVMIDVGTDDFLTSTRGVGASLEVSRPLYGGGPLGFGYRARFQPTSEGLAGFAEVGGGVNLKILSLQAIAGFGGAGDSAPFGGHVGGQVDLLLPGVEASFTRAWCAGGTTTRIDGRFYVAGAHRAYSLGLGWEQRLETRLLTLLAMGTFILPEL